RVSGSERDNSQGTSLENPHGNRRTDIVWYQRSKRYASLGQLRIESARHCKHRQRREKGISRKTVSWIFQAGLVSASSPNRPLLRREGRSLRPPIFPEHFLSGSKNGGVLPIRARSGLGSVGNYSVLQREKSRFLYVPVRIQD